MNNIDNIPLLRLYFDKQYILTDTISLRHRDEKEKFFKDNTRDVNQVKWETLDIDGF